MNVQMVPNASKCVHMTVTNEKIPLSFPYVLSNVPLKTVNVYRYHGVTLTSNLTGIRILMK